MDVTLKDNHEQSRYEILVDGVVAGFEVYEVGQGQISLVHTEVDHAYSGQGLAARLVEFALGDARSRGLGVLPYCPYVAKLATAVSRGPGSSSGYGWPENTSTWCPSQSASSSTCRER